MSDARSQPSGWWWVIALGALVGLAGGYLLGGQLTSTYTSTSQIVVQGVLADGAIDPADSILTSNQYVNQRMLTYPGIATSDRVLSPAAEVLGIDPSELAGTITATTVDESAILDLAVTGATAADAQARNEAVTNAVIGAIQGLENPPPPAPGRVALQIITPASTPGDPPFSPVQTGLLGAVVGALIGLAGAVSLANGHRVKERRRETYGDPARTNGNAAAAAARSTPSPPAAAPPRPADVTGRRGDTGRERP